MTLAEYSARRAKVPAYERLVRDAVECLRCNVSEATRARRDRDRAIREAFHAGVPAVRLAELAGVERARIYKILRRGQA